MISIVIPSYNQAKYLIEAINSVRKQSTAPLELIIVDDGSTDGSLEIAKSYEDNIPHIYVISQVNKGLASARNTGIMNSIGGWVLFLDADDVLLEDAVKKITEVIEETDADIVAPSFKEFGLSDREVILMANPTLKDFKVGNRLGYCAAFKRKVLLEVGGYNPKMIWGYEDLALTINLLTRGYKLVTIPEVLWMYRTKENSMITEAQKHHKELLAQINKDFPEAQLNF